MVPGPPLEIRPAGAAEWPAVEAVMDIPGDPGRCWCQYFLRRGHAWASASPGELREALREQVTGSAVPPGLVAYDGETPVGWVHTGPKASFPRVLSSRISAAPADEPDPDGLWAVTCFVVPRPHRRGGVARALLGAAVGFAHEHDATAVEGYAVDTDAGPPSGAAELYHGTVAMFADAGFAVVRRPTPRRAVVRLELA